MTHIFHVTKNCVYYFPNEIECYVDVLARLKYIVYDVCIV